MQSRVSSSLAVLTYLFLLSASDLVVAQISVPNCTSSVWDWSFNSIGQSPCEVAGYLLGTCFGGGVYPLDPILDPTFSYSGPGESESTNPCGCSTVSFNLLSACSTCQGATSRTWTSYSHNCTIAINPSTFPKTVPPETRVPQWALQDTTVENIWSATEAFTIGDTPEILPGKRIGPSGSKSNTAAIVGGAVGAVIAIAATAGLVFIFRRRRRRARAQAQSAALVVNDASPPPSASKMSYIRPASSYDPTPGSPMTLYDPNDPTTYPLHQDVPTSGSTPDVNATAVPHNGSGYLNGNNHTNLQPLRPLGYHGLPTV